MTPSQELHDAIHRELERAFQAGVQVTRGDIAQLKDEQRQQDDLTFLGLRRCHNTLSGIVSAYKAFARHGKNPKPAIDPLFSTRIRDASRAAEALRLMTLELGLKVGRVTQEDYAEASTVEGANETVPWPQVTSFAGGASLDGAYAWVDVRLTDGPEVTRFVRAGGLSLAQEPVSAAEIEQRRAGRAQLLDEDDGSPE